MQADLRHLWAHRHGLLRVSDYVTWLVHLRNVEIGDTRIYRDEYGNAEGNLWNYTDGNYSCDCNRALFLYNWKCEDWSCSDGRIVVDKIVREDTGEVLGENL